MATIVLSAAGMAIGGSLGGSVLGLSAAVVGRAAGATLGRVIDQRILGAGSEAVETGRIDRFRLTGASEGSPVAHLYGRTRMGGQVIWASRFRETSTTSGGGKGGPPKPKVTEYSYSVSLVVALCEGEISRVGRIWADGEEIGRDELQMTVYHGTDDQMPDPKMEAVEGAGTVPAYRGLAYVVFEDLELGRFGNRVPQFTFEVSRPGQGVPFDDMASSLRAVALMPGSGEYALATTAVTLSPSYGEQVPVNVNTLSGRSDLESSLDALVDELPLCQSVLLIISWFGDDLRAGECRVVPKIEQNETDASGMPWRVNGLTRSTATVVASDDAGRPIYGGTPTDASVVEALAALEARGQAAVFYPFLLMEQAADNTLINPYSGDAGQPALPWRGRITTALAPGLEGTTDRTAAAAGEVSAFFGQAQVSDFAVNGTRVSYIGPDEYSYRRFILHYAHLCAAAGGISAFCIGSEMRGLTQIRGAGDSFPAVEAFRQLAADVRSILGPDVKIGYAADWSEYHGYQPAGTGDKYFHLDPLWADDEIDFIGIDNYMPLSDWREETEHADANWGSIYNLDYLDANVAGGEGYDWFYPSPEARDAQRRTPIEDFWDEPWVWRYKDLKGWWLNYHHDRINGERAELPTAWEPGSKPIWFTEFGCAAIDKGTNQPNKFLDPKSSESAIPHYSTGQRDELIQMQYLRAVTRHFSQPENNPVYEETGLQMVDMDRAHVWAWDARPHPAFPALDDIWSDGENYARGHWITGRTSARPLASVVAEICRRSGVERIDTSRLHGLVRGYQIGDVESARSALQPLMTAYAFDAVERDGVLSFISRRGRSATVLEEAVLADLDDFEGALEVTRGAAAEVAGRMRLSFIEADGDYEVAMAEAALSDETTVAINDSELPLVLTRAEGARMTERWLVEARVARDGARFALPPSHKALGAGDIVELPLGESSGLFRIDLSEDTGAQIVEAVRVEPEIYRPQDTIEEPIVARRAPSVVPVESLFLDLPLMRGDEEPHAPHLAMTSRPWPGSVALYSAAQDNGYALDQIITQPSVIGLTESPLVFACPWLWDRGPGLIVRLVRGELAGASEAEVLAGANLAAIGDGSTETWELFQFADTELIAPRTYRLGLRLRGQFGTDAAIPEVWPEGSRFVLMDGQPEQIALAPAARGIPRHFRYGPAQRTLGDPSFSYRVEAFRGVGLRPYPVAHLVGRRDDAGVDRFRWIRRSRVGGNGWNGVEVPLGEASERYLVRVFEAGALRREETVTAPEWSYASAERASDGVSGPYRVEVSQVSEVFGPGPARALMVE